MKELFDQFKSLTDIFNAGRLVFYPMAGALIVLPAYLLIRIALVTPAPTLHAQVVGDLRSLGAIEHVGWLVVFASTVVGFLTAVVGFRVLERATAETVRDVTAQLPARATSYNFNYPLLRQKKDEDYATWLMSEYFRYVEIATYIPLGALTGLVLITLYVCVFVIRRFAAEGPVPATSDLAVLVLLVAGVIFIRVYFWPEVWVKRVIVPTHGTFLKAKCNLIDGIKSVERAVGPYKGDAPSQAVPPGAT